MKYYILYDPDKCCACGACSVACMDQMQKDLATGMTVMDRSRCIGCHSCAMACPFGIPRFSPEDGKVVKCDGCFVRLESGLQPACVRACAFGALKCVDEETFRRLEEEKAISAMLRAVNHL